jgi:tRNA(Ile)-lysidine synthase
MRDTEAIYREAVEQKRNSLLVIKGNDISLATDEFFSLTPLSAWAYELLAPFGFNGGNIRDIIGLKDALPGKEVLSNTHRLIRDRDDLIIVPRSNADAADRFKIGARDLEKGFKGPVILEFKLCNAYPGTFNTSPEEAYVDFDKLEFPLILRKWRRGDYFYPLGMKHRKKLSDFFTDLKFTKPEKENQWLLCSGENIIWIPGHRLDDRVKVETASKKILKILFRKTSKLD